MLLVQVAEVAEIDDRGAERVALHPGEAVRVGQGVVRQGGDGGAQAGEGVRGVVEDVGRRPVVVLVVDPGVDLVDVRGLGWPGPRRFRLAPDGRFEQIERALIPARHVPGNVFEGPGPMTPGSSRRASPTSATSPSHTARSASMAASTAALVTVIVVPSSLSVRPVRFSVSCALTRSRRWREMRLLTGEGVIARIIARILSLFLVMSTRRRISTEKARQRPTMVVGAGIAERRGPWRRTVCTI